MSIGNLEFALFLRLLEKNIKSGKARVLAWQGTLGAHATSSLKVGTAARCIKKAPGTALFKAPSTDGETESGGNNLTNVLCTSPGGGILALSPLNKGKIE